MSIKSYLSLNIISFLFFHKQLIFSIRDNLFPRTFFFKEFKKYLLSPIFKIFSNFLVALTCTLSNEGIKQEIMNWMKEMTGEFFEECFKNLYYDLLPA